MLSKPKESQFFSIIYDVVNIKCQFKLQKYEEFGMYEENDVNKTF